MAKRIKITNEEKVAILQDFAEMLSKNKSADGKISYTKSFGTVDEKATLVFTETAYVKMMMLIERFDKEVAWQGLAYRKEGNKYLITDILVYPQTVTSATVEEDMERSVEWSMGLEDEVYNNLRMQGHSHVNMGVTPSGTDETLYTKLLAQCTDKDFYIFLIWNKKGDKTIRIYDFEKNIIFNTSDCTVEIAPDELGIEKFLAEAQKMVRNKTYKLPIYSSYSFSKKTEESKPAANTPVTKSENNSKDKDDKKMGKRKGSRKSKNSSSSYNGYSPKGSEYSYDDDYNYGYGWHDDYGYGWGSYY